MKIIKSETIKKNKFVVIKYYKSRQDIRKGRKQMKKQKKHKGNI